MSNPSQHPVYYVNSADGTSLPVPLDSIDGTVEPRHSIIRGRKNSPLREYTSPIGFMGFPGVPYEQGVPNPSTYSQGEDVVLDAMLYYKGEPVIEEKYNITAVVKSDPHALNAIWTGIVDNGIYKGGKSGIYEIWIPSANTSKMFAGSYYLDIVLKEPVGTGMGPKDRTIFVASYIFNIAYSSASPNPESADVGDNQLNRSTLKPSWPPVADTIGTSSVR
jgi:hypothetical protein